MNNCGDSVIVLIRIYSLQCIISYNLWSCFQSMCSIHIIHDAYTQHRDKVLDKDFCFTPHWLKVTCQLCEIKQIMGQSYSISIEGLKHVAPKWSNRSSKLGQLVFSLGQWSAIVAYQISYTKTHTHIHTRTHTDTHRHTQTRTHRHRHTHRHTNMQTHAHTDRHRQTHKHAHTHTHTHTRTHAHTHTHTHTQTHTNKHTHIHTNTKYRLHTTGTYTHIYIHTDR